MLSTIQTKTNLLSVCFLLSLLFQGCKTEPPSVTGTNPSVTPQVTDTVVAAKPETKPSAATSATAALKPSSSPTATLSPTQPTVTPTPKKAGNQAAAMPPSGTNNREAEKSAIETWLNSYKRLVEDCSKTPTNDAERKKRDADIKSLRNFLADDARITYLNNKKHAKGSFIDELKSGRGFDRVLFGTPKISFTTGNAKATVLLPATFTEKGKSSGRERDLTLILVKQKNQWRLESQQSTRE